jgi:predicted transcriptional regulator
MELTTLKLKIIEEINSSENKDLLNEVLNLLHVDSDEEFITLSEKGKEFINEGLNDLEEGKIYSNEEVQRIFQEWKKK